MAPHDDRWGGAGDLGLRVLGKRQPEAWNPRSWRGEVRGFLEILCPDEEELDRVWEFQIPGSRGWGPRTPGSETRKAGGPESRAPHVAVLIPPSSSPGGNLDSGGEPLPPVPPPPSNPKPALTSPPRSPPVANPRSPGFSRRGSGRGAGPASWAPTWDSGAAPPALTQDEGAWPLRVTLLQSSF